MTCSFQKETSIQENSSHIYVIPLFSGYSLVIHAKHDYFVKSNISLNCADLMNSVEEEILHVLHLKYNVMHNYCSEHKKV